MPMTALRESLKNLAKNLRANALAAVIIAWLASVTLLGLFGGESQSAPAAIGLLAFAGVTLLAALSRKV